MTRKEYTKAQAQYLADKEARRYEMPEGNLVYDHMRRIGKALKTGKCYECGGLIEQTSQESSRMTCCACGETFIP